MNISDFSSDEDIKAGQVYSDFDMCSPEAYEALTHEVLSTPSRCPQPLPSTISGGITLLRLNEERVTHCFIVELPLGLLRDLMGYISTDDFVSLALTCRKFSKLLTDRYIGYQGINFYGELQERDIVSAARLQDLARGFKFVKTYASIRPEITGIFHINPANKHFYSICRDTLIEGVFRDTVDIVASRRNIPGVICTDVWEGQVASASDSLIALNSPEGQLVTAELENDHSLTIKFMGNGEYIVLLRNSSLLVYSKQLQRLHKIVSKGNFLQLYIPMPDKCTFVSVSEAFIGNPPANYNFLKGYFLKDANYTQLFERKYAQKHTYSNSLRTNHQIKTVLMHRVRYQSSNIDFLMVLFADGTLEVNKEIYGIEYQEVKLQEKLVIGLKNGKIYIFSADPVAKSLVEIGNYSCAAEAPVAVELWRTMAVIVTKESIEWCRKYQSKLMGVSKVLFPKFTVESVQLFEEFVLIKGKTEVWAKIALKRQYYGFPEIRKKLMVFPQVIVANFRESSYEGSICLAADLERAAIEEIEAEPLIGSWSSRHISLI